MELENKKYDEDEVQTIARAAAIRATKGLRKVLADSDLWEQIENDIADGVEELVKSYKGANTIPVQPQLSKSLAKRGYMIAVGKIEYAIEEFIEDQIK